MSSQLTKERSDSSIHCLSIFLEMILFAEEQESFAIHYFSFQLKSDFFGKMIQINSVQ